MPNGRVLIIATIIALIVLATDSALSRIYSIYVNSNGSIVYAQGVAVDTPIGTTQSNKILPLLNVNMVAGVTSIANSSISDNWTMQDRWVNVKDLGVIADGIQVDFTYSGTGTALDGKTRKRWVSASGASTSNLTRLQAALDAGYSLYFPQGVWVADGILRRKFPNTRIFGEGIDVSTVIGATISLNTLDDLSNLVIENLTLDSGIDFTPPAKLALTSETSYNASTNYDLTNVNAFYQGTGLTPTGTAIIYASTYTKQTGGIVCRNLRIKNYYNGISCGAKPDIVTAYKNKDILIENVTFDNILFQALGFNNSNNIFVINNTFRNCYYQPFDVSRGNENIKILGNTFDNCASMGKITGILSPNIYSNNSIVAHNIVTNPPLATDVHGNLREIIGNLSGNAIFHDNIIEVAEHQYNVISLVDILAVGSIVENNIQIYNNTINAIAAGKPVNFVLTNASAGRGYDNIEVKGNRINSNRPMIVVSNYGATKNLKLDDNTIKVSVVSEGNSLLRQTMPTIFTASGNRFDNHGYSLINATVGTAGVDLLMLDGNVFTSGSMGLSSPHFNMQGIGNTIKTIKIQNNLLSFIPLLNSDCTKDLIEFTNNTIDLTKGNAINDVTNDVYMVYGGVNKKINIIGNTISSDSTHRQAFSIIKSCSATDVAIVNNVFRNVKYMLNAVTLDHLTCSANSFLNERHLNFSIGTTIANKSTLVANTVVSPSFNYTADYLSKVVPTSNVIISAAKMEINAASIN